MTPAAVPIVLARVEADRHGRGIMLEVAERMRGGIRLNSGTPYRATTQLLAAP